MLRLGWFSSGREGSADLLATLLNWLEKKRIEASVAFVFCNWEEDEEPDHSHFAERQRLFELARARRVPLLTFSWKRFREQQTTGTKEEWKTAYGARLRTLLIEHHFDLGVLAGFTLVLDEETLERFELLALTCSPPGAPDCAMGEGIARAITVKAETYGCSMTRVRPDWDVPQPVAHCEFALRSQEYLNAWRAFDEWAADRSADLLPKADVEKTALFGLLRRDAQRREGALVASVVQMFASGRLSIKKGKVYEDDRLLAKAYDITREVEGSIAAGEF